LMSPSHDLYVRSKLGEDAILAKDRIPMCEFAIEDSDFLSISKWETKQKRFCDFPEVMTELNKQIQLRFGKRIPESSKPIQCMYICGSDHVIKCSLTFGVQSSKTTFPVLCIERPGKNSFELKKFHDKNGLFYYITSAEIKTDVSSTEIRKRLKEGKPIDDLTWPKCIDYLNSINHLKK